MTAMGRSEALLGVGSRQPDRIQLPGYHTPSLRLGRG